MVFRFKVRQAGNIRRHAEQQAGKRSDSWTVALPGQIMEDIRKNNPRARFLFFFSLGNVGFFFICLAIVVFVTKNSFFSNFLVILAIFSGFINCVSMCLFPVFGIYLCLAKRIAVRGCRKYEVQKLHVVRRILVFVLSAIQVLFACWVAYYGGLVVYLFGTGKVTFQMVYSMFGIG